MNKQLPYAKRNRALRTCTMDLGRASGRASGFRPLSVLPKFARQLLLTLSLFSPWVGHVQAEIYRCELANGVVEYNNTVAAGKDKNCKKIDLPQITTIPAPKTPTPQATGGRPSSGPTQTAARTSPGDFPKVDASTQKARDTDRRRIIEDELKKEEIKLSELKKEYNGGEPERQGDERNFQKYLDRVQKMKEDIARGESNVSALRKELGSVKE